MKSPGFKYTGRPNYAGHQDCGDCHPPLKNGKRRERQATRKALREYTGKV